jgi:hypothetical protein
VPAAGEFDAAVAGLAEEALAEDEVLAEAEALAEADGEADVDVVLVDVEWLREITATASNTIPTITVITTRDDER